MKIFIGREVRCIFFSKWYEIRTLIISDIESEYIYFKENIYGRLTAGNIKDNKLYTVSWDFSPTGDGETPIYDLIGCFGEEKTKFMEENKYKYELIDIIKRQGLSLSDDKIIKMMNIINNG